MGGKGDAGIDPQALDVHVGTIVGVLVGMACEELRVLVPVGALADRLNLQDLADGREKAVGMSGNAVGGNGAQRDFGVLKGGRAASVAGGGALGPPHLIAVEAFEFAFEPADLPGAVLPLAVRFVPAVEDVEALEGELLFVVDAGLDAQVGGSGAPVGLGDLGGVNDVLAPGVVGRVLLYEVGLGLGEEGLVVAAGGEEVVETGGRGGRLAAGTGGFHAATFWFLGPPTWRHDSCRTICPMEAGLISYSSARRAWVYWPLAYCWRMCRTVSAVSRVW